MTGHRLVGARLVAGTLFAAVALSACPVAGQTPAPPAARQAAGGAEAPAGGPALVRSIQELLTAVGYAPGPADGIAGAKTRDAIARFQRSAGMIADGLPSDLVRRTLIGALTNGGTAPANEAAASSSPPREAAAPPQPASTGSAMPSAAAGPAAAPAPIAAPDSLIGTTWRFRDENGAQFRLSFAPGGRFVDRLDPEAWTWTQDGDRVRIRYSNGWGVTVVRTGRLEGRKLTGRGTSTSGGSWEWSAELLAPPEIVSPFRTPAG